MNDIGQRIYDLRKKKGFSQNELAEKIGVSAKAVSKWETGEAQPTLDNVAHLAEIFEVSTDYLLKGAPIQGEIGKKNGNFRYLEPQPEKRHKLRVAGWIVLGMGIFFLVGGILLFVGSAAAMGGTDTHVGGTIGSGILSILLMAFGGFLDIAGGVLLYFGYAGAVARYAASETAPVVKDTTNYMLDGTRDELGKSLKTAVDSVKGDAKATGPVCPKCGTVNEAGALYCDSCGAPLTKKCPHCGEVNDADATHCRHCGNAL